MGATLRIRFDPEKGFYVYAGGKKQIRYEELLALTWLDRKRMPGPWKLVLERSMEWSGIAADAFESHIRRRCVFNGLPDKVSLLE